VLWPGRAPPCVRTPQPSIAAFSLGGGGVRKPSRSASPRGGRMCLWDRLDCGGGCAHRPSRPPRASPRRVPPGRHRGRDPFAACHTTAMQSLGVSPPGCPPRWAVRLVPSGQVCAPVQSQSRDDQDAQSLAKKVWCPQSQSSNDARDPRDELRGVAQSGRKEVDNQKQKKAHESGRQPQDCQKRAYVLLNTDQEPQGGSEPQDCQEKWPKLLQNVPNEGDRSVCISSCGSVDPPAGEGHRTSGRKLDVAQHQTATRVWRDPERTRRPPLVRSPHRAQAWLCGPTGGGRAVVVVT
jgi:hypothetical protein